MTRVMTLWFCCGVNIVSNKFAQSDSECVCRKDTADVAIASPRLIAWCVGVVAAAAGLPNQGC